MTEDTLDINKAMEDAGFRIEPGNDGMLTDIMQKIIREHREKYKEESTDEEGDV